MRDDSFDLFEPKKEGHLKFIGHCPCVSEYRCMDRMYPAAQSVRIKKEKIAERIAEEVFQSLVQ